MRLFCAVGWPPPGTHTYVALAAEPQIEIEANHRFLPHPASMTSQAWPPDAFSRLICPLIVPALLAIASW